MLDTWSQDRQTGYWFHFQQVGEEPERFVWEIWSRDKTQKLAQSGDGVSYTRLRTCGRGAQRHLVALISAGTLPHQAV